MSNLGALFSIYTREPPLYTSITNPPAFSYYIWNLAKLSPLYQRPMRRPATRGKNIRPALAFLFSAARPLRAAGTASNAVAPAIKTLPLSLPPVDLSNRSKCSCDPLRFHKM